jgi:two-component sensor histidine kinase
MNLNRFKGAVSALTPRKLKFWQFQLAGWLGFEAFVILRKVIQMLRDNQDFASAVNSFYSLLIYGFASLVLTSLIRYVYRWIYNRQLPISLTILWITLISVLITFMGTYFGNFLYSTLVEPYSSSNFMTIVWLVLWNFPSFLGWSILYFGIKYWNQWTIERARADKADQLAQTAQLQMLRYQLNPHFLFNSLNSIRALITEDQKASREMVTELAEFLRYSLVNKGYSLVPLRQEIEAIRHYFALEKKRFEEKLIVEIQVDPEAEEYPVLSFLLHPLVENAVKYGMRTSPIPLKIKIRADIDSDELRIRVENTGSWKPQVEITDGEGTGTGLNNIRLRLENAFPLSHQFTIGQEGDCVVALISISKKLSNSDGHHG